MAGLLFSAKPLWRHPHALVHTHREECFLDGSKSSQLASEYELSQPLLVLTEHHLPAQVIHLCS